MGYRASTSRILILIIMLIVVWLVIVEVSLRKGMALHQTVGRPIDRSSFIKRDPILGHVNTPGIYVYPPYTANNDNIKYTILSDGRRVTSLNADPVVESKLDKILLEGCSYTFGEAISDHQTFAYKLQAKHPNIQIQNNGVSGYGTYNSFLRLQKILPTINNPKKIIYGFIHHHEVRNVAPNYWMAQLITPRPFAYLDQNGNLVHEWSKNFKPFFLNNKLAIVRHLEHLYKMISSQNQKIDFEYMRLVTIKILQKMHTLSNEHGTKFYIVILDAKPEVRDYYMQTLSSLNINTIDCTHHDFSQFYMPKSGNVTFDTKHPAFKKLVVAGDKHPNEEMHTYWANCIDNII